MVWYGSTIYEYQLNKALKVERLVNENLKFRIESEVKRFKTLLTNKGDLLSFFVQRGDLPKTKQRINSLLGFTVERESAINRVVLISQKADILATYDPFSGLTGTKMLSVKQNGHSLKSGG